MNAEKSPVNHNVDHEEIAKFEAVASRWWEATADRKSTRLNSSHNRASRMPSSA